MFKLDRPQYDSSSSDFTSESDNSQTSENACVSCLDETMFPPRQKLPEGAYKKLLTVARNLAFVTLFTNVVVSTFGFFTSTESGSMATFGFAFDSFFAIIASIVLIWRFWSTDLDNSVATRRETNATAVIAFSVAVSSLAIIGRSIGCLYHSKKPKNQWEIIILSSVSVFAFTMLFIMKRMVAVKIGSSALMTDAIDSLCASLFAVSILISALVSQLTAKVWYLDASIAIVVSICSFGYGILVIARLVSIRMKRKRAVMFAINDLKEGHDLL